MTRHIRGTPLNVRPGILRIALVVTAVFLVLPTLCVPLLRELKGMDGFPSTLRVALVLGGAAAWAIASFTSATVWLTLSLAVTLASGLSYMSILGLVQPTLIMPATAPLFVAGLMSVPVLASFDVILLLGVMGGLGSQGVHRVQDGAHIETFVLGTLAVLCLLASPGVIGHTASRVLSPLHTNIFTLPIPVLAAVYPFLQPSLPNFFIGGLTLTLCLAMCLSDAPAATVAARDNARGSHWLLAALLTTLCLLISLTPDDSHALAALNAYTLIMTGTGVAVASTSFLASTARVWGPVRSGEFQMVTLDFVALAAYFALPLLYVLYLGLQQLLHAPLSLPFAIPPGRLPDLAWLPKWLQPLGLSHPLGPATLLTWMVVSTQDAFEESSILWAHWLVETYTLGRLDTRLVALLVSLQDMLPHAPSAAGASEDEVPPGTMATSNAGAKQIEDTRPQGLEALLARTEMPRLNIFVTPGLAAAYPTLCTSLVRHGHYLGVETAAGPFASPWTVMDTVSRGVRAVKQALVAGGTRGDLAGYMGSDGHRNPWALWRAKSLQLRFIAPVHRVVLGDNAGLRLCELLNPWCQGGLVKVEVGAQGSSGYVHLAATLLDLKERAEEGGYVISALSEVCPVVKPMVLPAEQGR